jgi:hypothetical protein
MQPDSFNNANLDGWLEDAVDHAELFDGFDRWSFIPEDSPSSEERSFEATIECVQGRTAKGESLTSRHQHAGRG